MRHTAVVGVCLLMTCDRSDRVTGPLASISDGSHESGNRNFFFLPPLVPNPSGSPWYEPLAFDPEARPVVEICLLIGSTCGGSQPPGFPLLFTMESGPGSELVRLSEPDQHFIVDWHAGDFDLDLASSYRIRVLLAGAELGYADVDVVSDGRQLRNVETNKYIGLVEGRTVPIKFRIERGAIAVVTLAEQITIADNNAILPPALIKITELLAVADVVRVTPPATVMVSEHLTVTDRARILPPAIIGIAEIVSVTDGVKVFPPVNLVVVEFIGVTDDLAITLR